MEAGTNVEYRCPACRDCSKCKNSDFTDMKRVVDKKLEVVVVALVAKVLGKHVLKIGINN